MQNKDTHDPGICPICGAAISDAPVCDRCGWVGLTVEKRAECEKIVEEDR